MLLPVQYKTTYPQFTANLKSPKLNFSRDDFFVKIKGYGKDLNWADSIIRTTDNATEEIRKKSSAEKVLHAIADNINIANQKLRNADLGKKFKSGILRTKRDGWFSKPSEAYTLYIKGRYSSYADRLNEVCLDPLKETPDDLAITRPINFCDIEHGEHDKINNSLDVVIKSFKTLFPKFLTDVKENDMPEINNTIAEMRWILAHATPWVRGSDAISNIFMRAMYKAIGIKSYPLKEGVSLDLEAYCTELSDYKKRFCEYFEKPPKIVE